MYINNYYNKMQKEKIKNKINEDADLKISDFLCRYQK